MTEGRDRSKMQLALFRLSHTQGQIELTAETYALLKIGLSEAMSQLKKGKQSNRKGKEPWNKGKIGVSPETSKRISDAKRGEKHQYFGKRLSEDIRLKMSLAKRGKSPSNKTELTDAKIADIKRMRKSMTLQQLSDATGVSVSVIRRVLRD